MKEISLQPPGLTDSFCVWQIGSLRLLEDKTCGSIIFLSFGDPDRYSSPIRGRIFECSRVIGSLIYCLKSFPVPLIVLNYSFQGPEALHQRSAQSCLHIPRVEICT